MKFVVAMMQHETNTFSALPTTLSSFAKGEARDLPLTGDAALDFFAHAGFAFSAFVDAVRLREAELVVPVAAYAEPSGVVDDDAFEYIANLICSAVSTGCDGVLLDLHGAMVVQSFDDGEGELLRRIRMIDGKVPIAVALDFHTNLSAQMVDNATIITGYCTYPHVDMYETGERAVRSLFRVLDEDLRPVMRWRALPMLTHMLKQTPARQPMKDIMDTAMRAESAGGVMNASVFGGFPLADIPLASFSAVVVVEGNGEAADTLLEQLMALAWQRRADFVYNSESLSESIARAATRQVGPVILADHGDNSGAGGSQDDMTVIAEVLAQGLDGVAAGPIWDPEAVRAMIEAGVGAHVSLAIGGKTDTPALKLRGKPLHLSGRVRCITDGTFTITGPMMTGYEVNLGPSAVLDSGTMELLVSSRRCEPYDLGFFTHAGIDPRSKRYVLIKSRQHFRAGFEAIAADIILVAGPGVCSSDYNLFPFKKLTRPIYPLDSDCPAGL